MREVVGDIWSFHPASYVVIPTNIGYTKEGANVMGAGVAKQAAAKFPGLADWYGSMCQRYGAATPVITVVQRHLILFPVKPLNPEAPWLSWKFYASLELIKRSAAELEATEFMDGEEVAVPLVGCGNGKLKESSVFPILRRYLSHNRFFLVRQPL